MFEQLVTLLSTISEQHHTAFQVTNGEDVQWPSWYAKQFLTHLDIVSQLRHPLTQDDLADMLSKFDITFREKKIESSWQQYYAEQLLPLFKE
ncbi:MAG TPA: hypothetical protein VMV38_01315 [Candidatus Paceibacterota bacterium]|nr:hypothetical protein [Candidatus Paceibacterota bacterium]